MTAPSGGTAPVVRRRGRPGHDRSTVLAASVEVFNERGYDGTSMEDLSARLGIGKSSIYHHVESKEALLGLALDRALDGLEQAATEVRDQPVPAVDRLEMLLRRSVAVLVERLPYVTLLLRVRGNTEVERTALTRRRRIDRLMTELVEEAVAEGSLRGDVDPTIVARLLFGTVNSLVEWLKPSSSHSTDELAGALVAVVFDGLRKRT